MQGSSAEHIKLAVEKSIRGEATKIEDLNSSEVETITDASSFDTGASGARGAFSCGDVGA